MFWQRLSDLWPPVCSVIPLGLFVSVEMQISSLFINFQMKLSSEMLWENDHKATPKPWAAPSSALRLRPRLSWSWVLYLDFFCFGFLILVYIIFWGEGPSFGYAFDFCLYPQISACYLRFSFFIPRPLVSSFLSQCPSLNSVLSPC